MAKISKITLLIAIGILIRLALLPVIEDNVARNLFIPFLENGRFLNENPWLGAKSEAFPYGGLMWLIVNSFRFVVSGFGWGTSEFSSILLLKMPLFLFETLFLFLGFRFSELNKTKWVLFFWLNPALIYISHIHGQLDVIPMYFTFLSFYFYGNSRNTLGALAFGAAIATKFHLVLLVPVIGSFLWNNFLPISAYKNIALFLVISFASVAVSYYLPYLAHQGAYNTVASNEATKLVGTFLSFGSSSLYLGMLLVLLVMFRLISSERLNRDSLIVGSAIIFLTVLSTTSPGPGWYYWVMPQLACFFILFPYAPKIILYVQIISYFGYFVGIRYFQEIQGISFNNLSFTFLQAINISIIWFIWSFTSRTLWPLGIRIRPISIGLAGDSGSGKNRLSDGIKALFGNHDFLEIAGDDYHKWERGHEAWQSYTHLNPRANFLQYLKDHVSQLMIGSSIEYPHYNHGVGKFTVPLLKIPKKALVIQGLHTLYLKGLRDKFDLKIFIEPHPLIRLGWKIDRDFKERGHSLEKVISTLKNRESDSIKFISSQQEFADCIIKYLPAGELSVDEKVVIEGLRLPFKIEYSAWNDAIGLFEEIALSLSKSGIGAFVKLDENFQDRLILVIEGDLSKDIVEELASKLFPNPRLVTRSRRTPFWLPGVDGLHQLVVLGLLEIKRDRRNFV